jgi:hypothetical protein
MDHPREESVANGVVRVCLGQDSICRYASVPEVIRTRDRLEDRKPHGIEWRRPMGGAGAEGHDVRAFAEFNGPIEAAANPGRQGSARLYTPAWN